MVSLAIGECGTEMVHSQLLWKLPFSNKMAHDYIFVKLCCLFISDMQETRMTVSSHFKYRLLPTNAKSPPMVYICGVW